MRTAAVRVGALLIITGLSTACATLDRHGPDTPDDARRRVSILSRARVWAPTSTRSLDLAAGPPGPGAFRADAVVRCTYVDAPMDGRSPKFLCRIGSGDVVKVKFGADNGEVFGEVLATRLLWALGFGADRIYPVTVVCRGCPASVGEPDGDAARRIELAVIERPAAGRAWPGTGRGGWAWNELNVISPQFGGASLAERDALKLLAVFLQHTDSKPQQQRVLCLGASGRRQPRADTCAAPFLMLDDVGLTFGRASLVNANDASGANLDAWRRTPVWKDDAGCRGNLPKSLTGTLDDPVISEEGRRFLADRLAQLSDRQLHALFAAARVHRRPRTPADPSSGYPTIQEWVEAFKAKRAEIAHRRCGEDLPPLTRRTLQRGTGSRSPGARHRALGASLRLPARPRGWLAE